MFYSEQSLVGRLEDTVGASLGPLGTLLRGRRKVFYSQKVFYTTNHV